MRVDQSFLGTGLDRYQADVATNGEFLLFSSTAAPAHSAGLVAGDNISVKDTEGLADLTGLAVDSGLTPTITIVGFTDLANGGTGWIDVNVDGSVTLTEVSGDMRLGLVRSRTSTVTLTADGSIVDAAAAGDSKLPGQDPQDVQGSSIDLTATNGSIGTEQDFVETNLDDTISSTGLLDADSHLGAYLEETVGNLRVGLVTSHRTATTGTTDVSLVARNGSILDGGNDAAADVVANRIDLNASAGIGQVGNDLDINSSIAGFESGGRLYAQAVNDVYITETQNELVVLAAKSQTGLVRLTVPDTNAARGPPADCTTLTAEQCQLQNSTPEDLDLIPTGTALIGQGVKLTTAPETATSPDAERDLGEDEHLPVDRRRPRCADSDGDRRRRDDHDPRRHEPRRRRNGSSRHAERDERRPGRRHEPLLRRPRRRPLDGVRRLDRQDRPDADLRPHRQRPRHVRPDLPRHLDRGIRQLGRAWHRRTARSRRHRHVPRLPPADDGLDADDERHERRHALPRRRGSVRHVHRLHVGQHPGAARVRDRRARLRRRRQRQAERLRLRQHGGDRHGRHLPAAGRHVDPGADAGLIAARDESCICRGSAYDTRAGDDARLRVRRRADRLRQRDRRRRSQRLRPGR